MKLMLRLVPLIMVFLICGNRLHAAPKRLAIPPLQPSYIEKDPRANKIIVVKNLALQKTFGAELAWFMQGLRPINAVNGDGVLRIRPPRGKRIVVPVKFRTFAIGPKLVNEYATAKGVLKITQHLGKASEYQWIPLPPALSQNLNGRQAEQSFAGSDYWMSDLGLEFLRWPNQKIIKRELRRGELCSVLVSEPAVPGGYSKIVSWVDEGTYGIVHADAYDAKGKLLKIFAPKSFKRIQGQWQLKEMEMRNEQADSRTSIIFELKKAAPKK
jgi:hypothetical protein